MITFSLDIIFFFSCLFYSQYIHTFAGDAASIPGQWYIIARPGAFALPPRRTASLMRSVRRWLELWQLDLWVYRGWHFFTAVLIDTRGPSGLLHDDNFPEGGGGEETSHKYIKECGSMRSPFYTLSMGPKEAISRWVYIYDASTALRTSYTGINN